MRYLPHIATMVLLLLAVYASTRADVISLLLQHMQDPVLGALVYILALALAVALAPLAAVPLIPIAAALFGPFLTGVYSIIGWTIGAVIAFLIARYAGRPLLSRLISLENLERYERLIPTRMEFLALLLLRMVIPVDILSYAVGVLSTISFWSYTLATFLGIMPFAFIFAYGSSAVAAGEYVVLGALSALAVVIFVIVWQLMRRMRRIPKGE